MTTGSDPLLGRVQDQPPEWTRYLAVDADLDIEVDTAAGEHATGRLTGNGHRLRLEFDRPETLTETTDRSTLTAVAAQLVRAQLYAELHGPRGRIAVVDPAHTSRVAAVLTGSPHISIDRPGWALAAPKDGPRDHRGHGGCGRCCCAARRRSGAPPPSVMTRRVEDAVVTPHLDMA